MPKTIELNSLVLRVLAVGIDRLNDGDSDDCQDAHEVEKLLAKAGFVVSCGQSFDADESTSGFVKRDGQGQYVNVTYRGDWSEPVEAGETLYLDVECTTPVRVIEDPDQYIKKAQQS